MGDQLRLQGGIRLDPALSRDEQIRLESLRQAVRSVGPVAYADQEIILGRARAFEDYVRGTEPEESPA